MRAFLEFNLFPFWPGILPVAVAQATSVFSKAVRVSFSHAGPVLSIPEHNGIFLTILLQLCTP